MSASSGSDVGNVVAQASILSLEDAAAICQDAAELAFLTPVSFEKYAMHVLSPTCKFNLLVFILLL